MKRINRRRPAYRDPDIEIPENPLEREFYENELQGSEAYFTKKKEENEVYEAPKRVCKKFYENAIYGKKAYERNREIEQNWKDILYETKSEEEKRLLDDEELD